jgi:hypothetical protein
MRSLVEAGPEAPELEPPLASGAPAPLRPGRSFVASYPSASSERDRGVVRAPRMERAR